MSDSIIMNWFMNEYNNITSLRCCIRSSQLKRFELSLPLAEEPTKQPHLQLVSWLVGCIVKWWWKMEEMKWLENMMYPMQRVWFRVATRFRIRKNGLLKLRHDVRACEYEDIQVMWEILNRNESLSEFSHSSSVKGNKKGQCWKLLRWARCTAP